MNRRAFLGAGATAVAASLAGCLSSSTNPEPTPIKHPGNLDTEFNANMQLPELQSPANGYPPSYTEPPEERTVDESQFGSKSTNGEEVALAPIEVAYFWHQRQEARFVDARGLDQYERSHIYGAVSSPAVENSQGGGIADWPKDTRIVAYCGCPHHLSSIRAAGLQKAGYTNVYVIDEGFGAWHNSDYPMLGTDFSEPEKVVIQGQVASDYAGEYAWATHEPSGQQEAAPIGEDGAFALHLKFSGMTGEMPIHVSTPAFEVTRPLGELTESTLTG
jgi:rhodanese-related sulfurtransferase